MREARGKYSLRLMPQPQADIAGGADGANTADGAGWLNGIGVLVTRPVHQAQPLAQLIEGEGGRVIRLPTIEITPIENTEAIEAFIDRLDEFDLAIFVSVNAVRLGLPLVHARRSWPSRLEVAAVGETTANALHDAGLPCAVKPLPPFNSESLLALDRLQPHAIAGRNIAVFRGVGGRELLAGTLEQRGARVEYAEVYRRTKPQPDAAAQISWDEIDVAVVTSSEGLRNLFDLVGETARKTLRNLPFVVVSERTAALARGLGVKQAPVVAKRPGDEAILNALLGLAAAAPKGILRR